MSKTNDILKEAITLPPSERAYLVDKLLGSLDERNKVIDELWSKEAESRIDAYDQGRIKSITIDKILEKYR